ncbi:efflux RND transporter permease subunit [bacterium]|nr:MAG: efflux RND transporter permease subunit [bacterium]
MNLTKSAIARPVFILMLVVAALLLGTIAYKSMRLELNPEVSFPTITVATVYPGAGPDEVATLVSKRIEDSVSGVSGLQTLSSSSQEGISTVTANFELGTDIDIALNDLRSRVDTVLNDLPDAAERPTIFKFDNSSQPVLYLALTSTGRSSRDLRDLIDNTLEDQFGQLPGVASTAVQGGDVREIQILLDKDKLVSYGIGINDVQSQIANATQNIPGGRITSGRQELSVRVLGEFKTVDQIRDSVITVSDVNTPNARNRIVRLRDIAEVRDGVVERTSYARLDGGDTVVLAIQKARTGNAVQITQAADKLIADISKQYPDIKITKTLEQAKQISESLADLNFTLYFAVFLVAVTVYVFLHNFRGTLIVALAIPVCVFVTFIALWMAGFTINNLTMLSLILATSVLVDDAIVVLENIFRHLRLGENPREAAINGRAEIGTAALAITMADVVVFLPIAFMGGIVGQFFKPMALGFVFAVLASLFVSFTLTPMLASRWFKAGEDMEHPTGVFSKAFERGFGNLERGYGRILEWALTHRWFVFILGNMALSGLIVFLMGSGEGLKPGNVFTAFANGAKAGIPLLAIATVVGAVVFVINLFRRYFRPQIILYGFLFGLLYLAAGGAGAMFSHWRQGPAFKFGFLPDSDAAQVAANIQLPPGSSLAATQEVVAYVENVFKKHPDVKYVVSNVGSQGVGGFAGSQGSQYAQVQATLYDKASPLDRLPWVKHEEKMRYQADTAVAADLLVQTGRVPGADVRISAAGGLGFGSPIQMSFVGNDNAKLNESVQKVAARLRAGAVAGVINVDTSSKPGKIELQAIPDRTRLADAGLTVGAVGAAVRTLYTGDDSAKFRVDGQEYDIRVQMSDKDRNNPNLVNEVPVRFSEGQPITLGQVTQLQERPGLDKVERRQKSTEIRLTADLLPGAAAGSIQGQINSLIDSEKLLADGVRTVPLGQADAQQREGGFIAGAYLLGLVLVYMLLASLYDNLLYPFIIQLAQPQAVTGALLGLILTDKSLNLIGIIGLVTLTGLVGKNAILLVDYANTLRDRGRSRHDALVEAGPTRLRPIAMTSIALILGTLPIALALGRGSEFRETIGIVIIGGIVVSTLLTLVVIPCSYTIFDDMSNWIGRLMRRVNGSEKANPTKNSSEPLTPANVD